MSNKKIKEKDDDYVYINATDGTEIDDSYAECDTLQEAEMIIENMDIGCAFLVDGVRPHSTKTSVQIYDYNEKYYVPLYNIDGLAGKHEKKICGKTKVKTGWAEKMREINGL